MTNENSSRIVGDKRREQLSNNLSVPGVSNFFPIERYYEAADKVYASYQLAYQYALKMPSSPKNNGKPVPLVDPKIDAALDDAFVYGKRYGTFVVQHISEHNYYETAKFKPLKHKHLKQVSTVLSQIEEDIKPLMDAYEKIKDDHRQRERKRREEERKRREQELCLAQERQAQARLDQFMKSQQQQQQKNEPSSSTDNVAKSAEEKLKRMNQNMSSSHSSDDTRVQRDPSGVEPGRTKYGWIDSSDEEERPSTLPPPLLPPSSSSSSLSGVPPPPSYNQALAAKYHETMWDPSTASSSASQNVPSPPPKKQRPNLPMAQLQKQYEKVYQQYRQAGKIRIVPINTYQGRLSASTNGCTVISALVASHHLRSAGVSDSQVCQVIDQQCGPLLRQIRSKLGLGGHSLIIPSDVHDHLVDCKLLQQEKFIGAAGGNILDPEHLGEFVKLLSVGETGQNGPCRTAATLFFREHVVSLVKNVNAAGQVVSYDIIDSMPGLSSAGGSKATRTVCANVEALQVFLHWYSSKKFSPSHCSYVDRNPWNDAMADLDPRVFQGFVWGDPPRQ